MLRYIISILILSILVILGNEFLEVIFRWLFNLYSGFYHFLRSFVAGGYIGALICQIIALILIPLAFAAIPALVCGLLTRRSFPYWVELAWVFWIILAVIVVVLT